MSLLPRTTLHSDSEQIQLDDRFLGVAPRVKTGKGQSRQFGNPANRLPMHNSLLKSGSTATTTFETRPVAISPVSKSFQQIQKLLTLNG
jgi:hypothetical protein